jgi:general secretion pathway protein K
MGGFVRQRGVAIITALLIVAIAATVSVTISTRLQLDVRRTGNMIAADQAYFYALAAESWSRRILEQDRKENEIDHLGEDWAIELPPIPVDGGYISGRLFDMQSCFNLNSLIGPDGENSNARAQMERLLGNLEIDSGYAQAVIDWLDTDLQTTIPDGAEDGYYMNLERPYRPANEPILSVSELRLIRGFDDALVYDRILPHICAFGVDASININTATEEVLRSLADNLSAGDVAQIIEQRTETPFNSINEFTSFNDLKKTITSTENLTVGTEYFMLETVATIGQVSVITYSMIHRDNDGETAVMSRTQGVY